MHAGPLNWSRPVLRLSTAASRTALASCNSCSTVQTQWFAGIFCCGVLLASLLLGKLPAKIMMVFPMKWKQKGLTEQEKVMHNSMNADVTPFAETYHVNCMTFDIRMQCRLDMW
eukprot:1138642-Pelagomonas_calceolata.AAC.4